MRSRVNKREQKRVILAITLARRAIASPAMMHLSLSVALNFRATDKHSGHGFNQGRGAIEDAQCPTSLQETLSCQVCKSCAPLHTLTAFHPQVYYNGDAILRKIGGEIAWN